MGFLVSKLFDVFIALKCSLLSTELKNTMYFRQTHRNLFKNYLML